MQNEEHKKPADAAFFMKFSLTVIGVVFGGLVLWSIFAPIQGAVTAPGSIAVDGNRKVVQHLEGGVISDIYVREGQRVEEGDVLVRLDKTISQASLSVIDKQLSGFYARRSRLIAERDGLEEMAPAEGVAEIINDPSFRESLSGQENFFKARAETAQTRLSLLEENIVQQNERISGLNAQIRSNASQTDIIEGELEGVRELLVDGFSTQIRLNELERQREALSGDRGSLLAQRAEAQSLISGAKLEIEGLKETRREDAIAELREVEGAIAEQEERRIAADDTLIRTEIKAPIGGRVLNLSVHTLGGVVGPGAPMMEIVPEGTTLLVTARIDPQNVDKIQAGQSTLVRFSGFGSRQTPETDGTVRTVSADAIIDEITGASFYMVMIDLPGENELDKVLGKNIIVPGMPVETFIRTDKRSAISYILKPLMDSFARSLREE